MAPCPLIGSHQPALWHLDAARGPSTPSFNHLVGAGEQRQRHRQGQAPWRFEIDHKFELGRLLDRQVGWLRALEICRRRSRPAGTGRDVRRRKHIRPPASKFAAGVDRRQPMLGRKLGDLGPGGSPPIVLTASASTRLAIAASNDGAISSGFREDDSTASMPSACAPLFSSTLRRDVRLVRLPDAPIGECPAPALATARCASGLTVIER